MMFPPASFHRGAARPGVVTVAMATLVAFGTPAKAVDRIGNTAIARNSVLEVASTKTSPIAIGDDVFANEQIKTGQDSAAKFVFSDQTNLALGPTSSVKLDRFVFSGDTTYAKAAVNFAQGAFRFTTGGSEKSAYQLKTSTATIGVRGTVFDVAVAKGVTTVTLLEGEIAICPRGRFDGDPRTLTPAQLKRHGCLDLTMSGQTTRVKARLAVAASTPVNFAGNFCGGDAGLCSATATASALPIGAGSGALDPNNPALCYVNPD